MWDTIAQIATAAIALLSGCGTSILYFRQEKKTKQIENEARQSEEWKKLYDQEREELNELRRQYDELQAAKDQKIDELYEQISAQRDCKAELRKQITALEVENTKLRLLKCEQAGCPNRKPPTGY